MKKPTFPERKFSERKPSVPELAEKEHPGQAPSEPNLSVNPLPASDFSESDGAEKDFPGQEFSAREDREEKNKILPATLYLVATPIGNLDDITLRALKVLRECDFIAAEDTRVTGKLLSFFGLSKPMVSYEEHSKHTAGQTVLRRLLAGQSCALVTDAGTPGISDPGEDLVRLCLENGLKVVPVPGPCAAVAALTVSGLPTRRFVFEGFLEGKQNQKRARLEELSSETRTVLFYEAPHRIAETVALMAEVLGPDRRAVFCREITKRNEEFFLLPLGEACRRFEKEPARGEYVIVLEGRKEVADAFWASLSVKEHVDYYTEKMGLDRMAAIKVVAKDRGVPKNEIYRALLEK